MFQNSVNVKQAFGLIGSFYDDAPRIVDPYTLAKNGDALPAVGKAFTTTVATPTVAKLGGSDIFAGILVSPHEYVKQGLGDSLELADGTIGQICKKGRVVVKVATAVSVGYNAFYNATTGDIAGASASTLSGYVAIPNAKFVLVNSSANELAVLELD